MSEGKDEKGRFTDEYVKAFVKRINAEADRIDDIIHDYIVNPEKYKDNRYNGFIPLISDGKEERQHR